MSFHLPALRSTMEYLASDTLFCLVSLNFFISVMNSFTIFCQSFSRYKTQRLSTNFYWKTLYCNLSYSLSLTFLRRVSLRYSLYFFSFLYLCRVINSLVSTFYTISASLGFWVGMKIYLFSSFSSVINYSLRTY